MTIRERITAAFRAAASSMTAAEMSRAIACPINAVRSELSRMGTAGLAIKAETVYQNLVIGGMSAKQRVTKWAIAPERTA